MAMPATLMAFVWPHATSSPFGSVTVSSTVFTAPSARPSGSSAPAITTTYFAVPFVATCAVVCAYAITPFA